MLVRSAAFIGLGCQNHRNQRDVLQQGDNQADAKPAPSAAPKILRNIESPSDRGS